MICLILDSSVSLWVRIRSAGDLVSQTSKVGILHSAEEDNLSPFCSKIPWLCQCIKIKNRHECIQEQTYVQSSGGKYVQSSGGQESKNNCPLVSACKTRMSPAYTRISTKLHHQTQYDLKSWVFGDEGSIKFHELTWIIPYAYSFVSCCLV